MLKENFYEKSKWYINTYNALGCNWIISSIEKLNLKENYIFVNLSANAGYYERDAYKIHYRKYNPTYYIGDIVASKLNVVKSFEQFNYIQGNNDAVTMDTSKIPNKADIIVDCKGALWHTLVDRKSGKKQLISLLENYCDLMNDTGVLLIDFYEIEIIKFIFQKIQWKFKGNNKKITSIDCFGELSTYHYLTNLCGKKGIDKLLNTKKEITAYPLASIMDTAYISKNDLEKLIEKIEKIPSWRFVFEKPTHKLYCVSLIIFAMLSVLAGVLINSIL